MNNKFDALKLEDSGEDDEGSQIDTFRPAPKPGPGEHPLQFNYSIWFSKRTPGNKTSTTFGQHLKFVASFASVEQFWAVYSHLARPSELTGHSDYHLFKEGIRPMWEDDANKLGGKWIIRLKKGLASRCWENLVLAMLGEQFVVGEEICGAVVSVRFQTDIKDDKFLENDFCPACLGHSGCGLIYFDQVHLSGLSGYRVNQIFNTKNIYYGSMGDQKIVFKKLGSDTEIRELDKKICKEANRPEGCDVPRVLFKTDASIELRKEALQPKHLKQSVGMFTCASYRLLDRLWTYYKEKRKEDMIMLGDKMQLWYTANLNSEPLLLQTFPASERWPFPHYYGACGRHILVEHVGKTLEEYRNEPFHKRAGIAYELLKIAELLTNNNEDFALYMTDLNWENFGVDAAGKVRILDAENIIVVDKLALEAKKPRKYDEFLQSMHHLCEDSRCLAFNANDLCTRLHSDHNYYAVCFNLLDPLMTDPLMPGGKTKICMKKIL
ncbi:hypothetical protein C0Q70_20892 [Pomacea canaliculata]|uniref:FAM69 protein-kinase domain-containing protein n=1 Tax=Pomacea canaliculata TaxID=400727 RepID=A0A2T7NAZ6_POMCA|nr:hypothetical protein C0Q70_20892 [Pomacea canaliculata]